MLIPDRGHLLRIILARGNGHIVLRLPKLYRGERLRQELRALVEIINFCFEILFSFGGV